MARWLPRWVAEAIAVPAAAQLACTPVVAAISGQVSLVAVAANLVVAPAVAPATVLGLGGGLVGLVWAAGGRLLGTLAGWCVAWIVAVATRGADLPTAAVGLGDRRGCARAADRAGRRDRAGRPGCCCAARSPGCRLLPAAGGRGAGPPADAGLAAGRLGAGGVRRRAGRRPGAQRRPARRGRGRRRPRPGRGRPLPRPARRRGGAAGGAHPLPRRPRRRARRRARRPHGRRGRDQPGCSTRPRAVARGRRGWPTPVRRAVRRRRGRSARSRLQVLWPPPDAPTAGPGDGSTANDASVVLLVEVRGVRILLTGDVEPEGQAALARALPGLRGRRAQGAAPRQPLPGRGLAAARSAPGSRWCRWAPTTTTATRRPRRWTPLEAAGARVLRTDRDGDLAVVERDGELRRRHRVTSRSGASVRCGRLAAPWQVPRSRARQTSSAGSRW